MAAVEEVIFFDTSIKRNQSNSRTTVTSNLEKEWKIEELWFLDDQELVQEINLVREEIYQTSVYATLEVFPIPNEEFPDSKHIIEKSIKSRPDSVQFQVLMSEYRLLKTKFGHSVTMQYDSELSNGSSDDTDDITDDRRPGTIASGLYRSSIGYDNKKLSI